LLAFDYGIKINIFRKDSDNREQLKLVEKIIPDGDIRSERFILTYDDQQNTTTQHDTTFYKQRNHFGQACVKCLQRVMIIKLNDDNPF